MPQAPKPLEPDLSARHRFGAELRAARLRRGLSQASLAGLIPVHPDSIAKVEKADRWPTEALAMACDVALEANGRLVGLWSDVAAERKAAASRPSRIAGRGDAGSEALEPLDEVAQRLWTLGTTGGEPALGVLEVAVTDFVRRYEVEGPAKLAPDAVRLRRRLEALLSSRPSIKQRQQLLRLSGQTSGLLAYMAVNLGRFAHAEAYGTEAFTLAREAGDRGLMAWVRGTQSFASYYRHDYEKAVALARDGLAHAGRGPQAVRLLVNCEARALAFLPGHQRDAEDAVSEAYQLAEQYDAPSGISPCISLGIYSSGRVVANAITVFRTLAQPRRTLALLNEIDAMLQTSDSAWSRSLVSLDHAAILLQKPSADVEQSMQVAINAVAASAESPITSVLQRARALAAEVEQFSQIPSVQEFREQIRRLDSRPRQLG